MLGERLAELRRHQGLSQQEVANLLGVTRQTVSNWECNQGAPTLDKAAELARAYHMSLDELADVESVATTTPSTDIANSVSRLVLQPTRDSSLTRIFALTKSGTIAYEAQNSKTPLGSRDLIIRDGSGRKSGSLAQRTTPFMGFDMVRITVRVDGFDKVEAVRDMEQFSILYRLHGEGLSLASRDDETGCDVLRNGTPFASIDINEAVEDGFATTFADDVPMDLAVCVAMALVLLLRVDRPKPKVSQ